MAIKERERVPTVGYLRDQVRKWLHDPALVNLLNDIERKEKDADISVPITRKLLESKEKLLNDMSLISNVNQATEILSAVIQYSLAVQTVAAQITTHFQELRNDPLLMNNLLWSAGVISTSVHRNNLIAI